ncbi:MAG: hypothetical protein RRY12_01650 [Cloacibacillus sp.]
MPMPSTEIRWNRNGEPEFHVNGTTYSSSEEAKEIFLILKEEFRDTLEKIKYPRKWHIIINGHRIDVSEEENGDMVIYFDADPFYGTLEEVIVKALSEPEPEFER